MWWAAIAGLGVVAASTPGTLAFQWKGPSWLRHVVVGTNLSVLILFTPAVRPQLGAQAPVPDSAWAEAAREYVALHMVISAGLGLAATMVLPASVALLTARRQSSGDDLRSRLRAVVVTIGVAGRAAAHFTAAPDWLGTGLATLARGAVAASSVRLLLGDGLGRKTATFGTAEALAVASLAVGRIETLDAAWAVRSFPVTSNGFDPPTYPLVALGVAALGVAVVGAEPGWRRIVVLFAAMATLLATAFM